MLYIVTTETAGAIMGIFGVFYRQDAALRAACEETRWDLVDDDMVYYVSEIEVDVHVRDCQKLFVIRREGDRPVIRKWEGKR